MTSNEINSVVKYILGLNAKNAQRMFGNITRAPEVKSLRGAVMPPLSSLNHRFKWLNDKRPTSNMPDPLFLKHSKGNWFYFCIYVTDASDSETVLSLDASDVRCMCLFFFTLFSFALSREQLTTLLSIRRVWSLWCSAGCQAFQPDGWLKWQTCKRRWSIWHLKPSEDMTGHNLVIEDGQSLKRNPDVHCIQAKKKKKSLGILHRL